MALAQSGDLHSVLSPIRGWPFPGDLSLISGAMMRSALRRLWRISRNSAMKSRAANPVVGDEYAAHHGNAQERMEARNAIVPA
jgi:hypothetical protein